MKPWQNNPWKNEFQFLPKQNRMLSLYFCKSTKIVEFSLGNGTTHCEAANIWAVILHQQHIYNFLYTSSDQKPSGVGHKLYLIPLIVFSLSLKTLGDKSKEAKIKKKPRWAGIWLQMKKYTPHRLLRKWVHSFTALFHWCLVRKQETANQCLNNVARSRLVPNTVEAHIQSLWSCDGSRPVTDWCHFICSNLQLSLCYHLTMSYPSTHVSSY